MGVISRSHNETHIDNGDGTCTVLVSHGMNYLSGGEWQDSTYYYLQSTGQHAWSNTCDDNLITLDMGVVRTANNWWQVEGIYIGEVKIWEPDFTDYVKLGDTVSYKTPWGTLNYTIRPEGYKEVFVFETNPLSGALHEGDLVIKYNGTIDATVWAKDASGIDIPVESNELYKAISLDDMYRAKYPLEVDPETMSFTSDGDANAAQPSNLYGNSGNLMVGQAWTNKPVAYLYTFRAMSRFNLTALAGKTITEAVLKFHKAAGLGFADIYGVSSTANPEAMTASTLYTTAASGGYLGQLAHSSLYGKDVLTKKPLVSVTPLYTYLQSRVGSYALFGLVADGYNSGGYQGQPLSYYSEESAVPDYRPSLEITYQTGSGYTLTYDNNGGSGVSPANRSSVTTFSNPDTNPTRAGFRLVGWATTAGASEPNLTVGQTISANTTAYAVWKIANALFVGAGL